MFYRLSAGALAGCTLLWLNLGAMPAAAAAYELPPDGDAVVGVVTDLNLHYEDTLAGVAQRLGLGYYELLDANPRVDPWLPGEGTRIQLPTEYVLPSAPREGIVINVAEYRLYYYPPDGRRVITFPVGLGRQEYPTPLVRTKVVAKIENPSWTPTAVSRKEHAAMGDILPAVVPAGPDNPLGHLAMQLALPGYFIHGTNKPFGVGQSVSQGCIRLYDGHIETLVELADTGTPVQIVNEPYKVGWRNGDLYVEVHHPVYGVGSRTDLNERVVEATKNRATAIDWARLEELFEQPTGVPVKL
ncbi:MAG: L,D-transpeptidase family protein [Pseudomonadales bacterium]